MEDLFAHIDSDERMRRLFSIAGRVYRDSILYSNLKPKDRIIENLDDLDVVTRLFKLWGAKVVLTMGTFDLLHVGHARYTDKARENGNLLILGVEDDERARGRKGENRPAVPYAERSELMSYLRQVDLIAIKSNDQPKWAMIKTVRPHILIAVKGTYKDEDLVALCEFCGEVVVLERQAETSTSAQIRRMVLDGADNFNRILMEELPQFTRNLYEKMKRG